MRIESDMRVLEAIVRIVGTQPDLDLDQVMQVLREHRVQADEPDPPGGKAHTTDIVQMDLGVRSCFQRALNGETVIPKEPTDYADGEPIYVYATPIRRDGRVEAVLFAANAADTFASVINVRIFDGAGYSRLTNADGDILLHPDHPDSDQALENIFTRMEAEQMLSTQKRGFIRRRVPTWESGVSEYRRAGKRRYLSDTPIEVDDWYKISVVSGHVAKRKFAYLTMLTLVVCIVTVSALIGLFGYIRFMQNRRRELEKIVFARPVTGGTTGTDSPSTRCGCRSTCSSSTATSSWATRTTRAGAR